MSSFCSHWGVASLALGVLGAGCGFGPANNSPIVTEGPEVSLKDVVSGTEVQMHLVVEDEDGDDLAYRWIQAPSEPAGRYSDPSVEEPTWIAPEVTAGEELPAQGEHPGRRGLLAAGHDDGAGPPAPVGGLIRRWAWGRRAAAGGPLLLGAGLDEDDAQHQEDEDADARADELGVDELPRRRLHHLAAGCTWSAWPAAWSCTTP